jgi:hypothetical protein
MGHLSSSVDFTQLRWVTSMEDLGFSMPLRSASEACNLEPPTVVLKGSEKPSKGAKYCQEISK